MSTTKEEPTKAEVDVAFKAPGTVIARDSGDVRVALVHPQWGGYCFPVAVQFCEVGDGRAEGWPCLEVFEFANEEFPKDFVVTERHYCDPVQIVEFGIQVLEAMKAAGHRDDPRTGLDLRELAERLVTLDRCQKSINAADERATAEGEELRAQALRTPSLTTVRPMEDYFTVGSRVRVLEWREAENDQSKAPCMGTVAAVEDDRIYVQPDGLDGHWLALRAESLPPDPDSTCSICLGTGAIRDMARGTYHPCGCSK